MFAMFQSAFAFNKPLNHWNVSNVTNMKHMFADATVFNQNINRWDVSNVKDMSYMFSYTKAFNQPLSFDISSVINMKRMFYYAKEFTKKHNNDKPLPNETDDIKKWFNLNRDKMNEIDIQNNHGKDIEDFFSIFDKKSKEMNK